jgi:hypothetical protein
MKSVIGRGLLCGVLLLFGRGPLFAQTAGTQATPRGTTAPPRVWGIPLSACEAVTGLEKDIKAVCGSYEVFEDRTARSGHFRVTSCQKISLKWERDRVILP